MSSTVSEFIRGLKKDVKNYQIVYISDLYSTGSTLDNFIEIINA